MVPIKSQFDEKLSVLLRDYGYSLHGNTLIRRGVRGYLPDAVIGQCRDLADAAERICPLVADDAYTKRLIALSYAD